MDCSPFFASYFWGLAIFFFATTCWFFVLWTDNPRKFYQYWQNHREFWRYWKKNTATLLKRDDIVEFRMEATECSIGDMVHEARILHFNHDIFSRVSVEIEDYSMPVGSALRIRRCSPNQLVMKHSPWNAYCEA